MDNKPYKLATITGYYDYTSSSAISYIQCIVNSAIQENVEFSMDDIREFLAKTKFEINGAVLKLVEVEMIDIDDVQG
jgi:predicted transcriptional regulator